MIIITGGSGFIGSRACIAAEERQIQHSRGFARMGADKKGKQRDLVVFKKFLGLNPRISAKIRGKKS